MSVFTAKMPNFMSKTLKNTPKWHKTPLERLLIMAKAITTTINTVSGNTVKVDKLESRTFRTVKEGDFLYTAMSIKGQRVYFYGKVESTNGNPGEFVISFGSHGKTVIATVPKGAKVNVYRPTPA